MTVGAVTKTITEENVFSDSIPIMGFYNYSVSGIDGDTVVIQRSYDNGTTWKDFKSIAADVEDYGYEVESGMLYRVGVKTGGYSAGTILARISF